MKGAGNVLEMSDQKKPCFVAVVIFPVFFDSILMFYLQINPREDEGFLKMMEWNQNRSLEPSFFFTTLLLH